MIGDNMEIYQKQLLHYKDKQVRARVKTENENEILIKEGVIACAPDEEMALCLQVKSAIDKLKYRHYYPGIDTMINGYDVYPNTIELIKENENISIHT